MYITFIDFLHVSVYDYFWNLRYCCVLYFYIFEWVMKIVVKYFKIHATIAHSTNHAIYTNINKHTPFIQMLEYEI